MGHGPATYASPRLRGCLQPKQRHAHCPNTLARTPFFWAAFGERGRESTSREQQGRHTKGVCGCVCSPVACKAGPLVCGWLGQWRTGDQWAPWH